MTTNNETSQPTPEQMTLALTAGLALVRDMRGIVVQELQTLVDSLHDLPPSVQQRAHEAISRICWRIIERQDELVRATFGDVAGPAVN